jgi:APA family basic amino acid/polyamine antiporter
MLMFKEPERFSGRRLALDATIAVLAFAYSFWMVYGAGETYIAQGFLLLLAGIPVYIWLKWRQAVTDSPIAKLGVSSNGATAGEKTPAGATR